jgi:hypothetical protein
MSARGIRKGIGPVEVYAYHDYASKPWRSPLYAGVWVGSFNTEVYLSPESRFRPFSGE